MTRVPPDTRRACAPLTSRTPNASRRFPRSGEFLFFYFSRASLINQINPSDRSSQGEEFSAHVSVDRTSIPSVVVGGADVRELRGPSFRSRSSRARDDAESASFGRQHGSFSAISFLQRSLDSDGDLSPSLSNLSTEEDGGSSLTNVDARVGPERASLFEFNGGNSEFTSATPNEMSFMWNSLGDDANAAIVPASPPERDVGILRKPSPKPSPDRHPNGAQSIPPRVVVVHVDGDDEGCVASAGRKQRGSFSSLLLLEAHELSTLDSSPNSQRRGAMQAHIEDEFVTRGLEKGAPVASTRVAA